MNALAQVLAARGIMVCGSDRGFDRGDNVQLMYKLRRLGIELRPQDGSGVGSDIDRIIVSRAVEKDNPDLKKGKKLKIPVCRRQDEWKRIFREHPGIAVAGTSGKTTVVGMLACIFEAAGVDIKIVNGGITKNYVTGGNIGNVVWGGVDYYCMETDESEGDLKGYGPHIGVLTNMGRDHMSGGRLADIYREFIGEIKDVLVINNDIEIDTGKKAKITFSVSGPEADISVRITELRPEYSIFSVDGFLFRLYVPGRHNIENAAAAIGVAYAWGVPVSAVREGLRRFRGIARRFEVLSEVNGIKVVDDFAHNPDKVKAAFQAAGLEKGRVMAVYQPHGYGPTKMFMKEMARVFAANLGQDDFLFVPEIYYAGGTVDKDVSSADLVAAIKKINGMLNVYTAPRRDNILRALACLLTYGDTVLVMGARDVTLHQWAEHIL